MVQIHPDPPFIGRRKRPGAVFLVAGKLYEVGRQKDKSGAIAQLGEHLLCKQGVVGSIPTGSTIFRCTHRDFQVSAVSFVLKDSAEG